eukprot:4830297-Prymnesium_polylepis.2
MKADHPAERVSRARFAACGVAACSRQRVRARRAVAQRGAEGRPPRQGTRGRASWAQARHDGRSCRRT